jgi:hypothetical protein
MLLELNLDIFRGKKYVLDHNMCKGILQETKT